MAFSYRKEWWLEYQFLPCKTIRITGQNRKSSFQNGKQYNGDLFICVWTFHYHYHLDCRWTRLTSIWPLIRRVTAAGGNYFQITIKNCSVAAAGNLGKFSDCGTKTASDFNLASQYTGAICVVTSWIGASNGVKLVIVNRMAINYLLFWPLSHSKF